MSSSVALSPATPKAGSTATWLSTKVMTEIVTSTKSASASRRRMKSIMGAFRCGRHVRRGRVGPRRVDGLLPRPGSGEEPGQFVHRRREVERVLVGVAHDDGMHGHPVGLLGD